MQRNYTSKFLISFLFLALISQGQENQEALTIQNCYELAAQNYPLVKQFELIKKSKDLSVENAGRGYFPQISVNGQATYQSAVTAIPITLPGVTVPELSKDQYKLYADVNQPLYDGGVIKQQKRLQEANSIVEEQKISTELYKLKERINQLFFGVLLIDGQMKQVLLLIEDLQINLERTDALFKNGTALKSSSDLIRAEILKTKQRVIELRATRKVYTDMLGLLLKKPINEKTTLIAPQVITTVSGINRPELVLLDQQAKNLEIQRAVLKSKTLPKFNLFLQAGYGRPALNMLSNTFEPYYIGGLRLNWNLSSLYTLKNDYRLLEINRNSFEVQKELILFNTKYTANQFSSEINKLSELLISDTEIIELRTSIKTTSTAQLQNGVISAGDYLKEVHAEEQARENKTLHEIQLLMAQYNEQINNGN